MDMPPAIVGPITSGTLTFSQKSTKIVLTIRADGVKMRDNVPLVDLPKEQLLIVIDELVEVMKQR